MTKTSKHRHELTNEERFIPANVRMWLAQAKKGGAYSYAQVGWHLGIQLHTTIGMRLGTKQADTRVSTLEKHFANKDFKWALCCLDWDVCYLMWEIPKNRRISFLKGLYAAYLDDRLWG